MDQEFAISVILRLFNICETEVGEVLVKLRIVVRGYLKTDEDFADVLNENMSMCMPSNTQFKSQDIPPPVLR